MEKITRANLLQWMGNYRWMVESIKEARYGEQQYMGAKVAQYGLEASLPKAVGGTSDAVFNEVNRRISGTSQRIKRYEYQVQQIQKRIPFVQGDREIEVLHRLLDGSSMRAVSRHMRLSETTIKRVRETIIEQMTQQ